MDEKWNDSSSQERLIVSTILLAGGKSKRMGQDKALIEVRGKPLIQHIALTAQTLTEIVYVVTPWGDRYQSLLPEGCVIIPESESIGPLGGFLLGLRYVVTDWCLLLPCDLPNLTVEVLEQWYAYLFQVPDEAIALLPEHPKGWNPISGFYRTRCLRSLESFIQEGGRSFQAWLAQEVVCPLQVEDSQVLFNCNTPLDLDQLN